MERLSEIKLLPCPFCGREAKINDASSKRHGRYRVRCKEINCTIRPNTEWHESLDEAIEYVKEAGCTLEDMECEDSVRVEFIMRDWEWMQDALADLCDADSTARYSIFSCDLEDAGECDEVAGRY